MRASERDSGREWSRLHAGIDPARVPLLWPWLRAMWWLARPLVRLRVPPLALTAVGALAALAAVPVARPSPVGALGLVLLAMLCDGLDGAVAVLARRPTHGGAVMDKIADRVADTAFALVIWRCGAPLPLALVAAVLSAGHEGMRWWRGGALASRLTVNERPTRVICTVIACACAAVATAAWPATVCAAVWVVLAVIGLAQFAWHPAR